MGKKEPNAHILWGLSFLLALAWTALLQLPATLLTLGLLWIAGMSNLIERMILIALLFDLSIVICGTLLEGPTVLDT